MTEKAMNKAFSGTSAHVCAEAASACSSSREIVSILGISLLMSFFVIIFNAISIIAGIIIFLVGLVILLISLISAISYRQEQKACIC